METVQVTTDRCGTFNVHIQGTIPKNAPVILTVPDLGCDHTYYAKFVNSQMLGRFCWCHVELPGQSYGSSDWTETSSEDANAQDESSQSASFRTIRGTYPTMKELAEGVGTIMENLNISQAVLFGEGAGANLLSRVAILFDDRVLGLLLIHGRCTPSGPLKLLREKMRNWKSNKLDPATERYLLEHRFSAVTEAGMHEPLKSEFLLFRRNLNERINIKNLNLQTYSYAHRTTLADTVQQINCPVILITGTKSDHRSGVRNMYETINKANKINPQARTNAELIEFDNTLSPLIEKPDKLCECALYFFQGIGLVTSSRCSISSGDAPVNPTSGEKQTCEQLSNVDSTRRKSREPPMEIERQQSGDTDSDHVELPARYLNRQMSMADLDLPRGADALSSFKLLSHDVPRSPQRSQSTKSENPRYSTMMLEQTQHH